MNLGNQVLELVRKDVKVELRKKSTLNGILLYVVSTVFVSYLIFSAIEELTTWVALLWIIILFAGTNASINNYRNETGRQFFYYYTLSNPRAIVLSKYIFNTLLLFTVAALTYLLFNLLLGNPVENSSLFLATLFLGTLSISSVLNLTTAIASKTNNNATLTAILSFPILLPTLLTAIKSSVLCGLGFGWEETQVYLATLLLLNVLVLTLSFLLFPYLWRS